MYKKAQASIWTTEEINLLVDHSHHFQELLADEQHFLSHALTVFVTTGGILVNNNLLLNFAWAVQRCPQSNPLKPAASIVSRLLYKMFMQRSTLC
jgi:ribonucleotide reductase beta subunit family protein with ferritin-like domain